MKKSRGSSAPGGRAAKKEKSMKRRKVDFSDIPELSDKQLSRMRRVGRPTAGDEPRKLIGVGVRHNNHYSLPFVHFHVNRIRLVPIR